MGLAERSGSSGGTTVNSFKSENVHTSTFNLIYSETLTIYFCCSLRIAVTTLYFMQFQNKFEGSDSKNFSPFNMIPPEGFKFINFFVSLI